LLTAAVVVAFLLPVSRGTFVGSVTLSWLEASKGAFPMGRGLLLWLIGIPIPIIVLIWLFGGLHG